MTGTLVTLTVFAIAVAAVMTVIVVRLVLQERRRSAARVAALEADIYRTNDEDIEVLHDRATTVSHNAPLFPEQGRQRPVPIAPLIAVGAAVMFVFLVAASRHRT